MGKGSYQRPGKGYQEAHERIMPTKPKRCQACGLLPVWCKCRAAEAPKERLGYERRKHERG